MAIPSYLSMSLTEYTLNVFLSICSEKQSDQENNNTSGLTSMFTQGQQIELYE